MRLLRRDSESQVGAVDGRRTLRYGVQRNDGRAATGAARTVGSVVASCSGAAGAAFIASNHGNDTVAVTVFLIMQAWTICDLICRWRLKWRGARLQEAIARKAMEHPKDQNLRTLLVDVASTHLDDLGMRLPVRPQLMEPPFELDRQWGQLVTPIPTAESE